MSGYCKVFLATIMVLEQRYDASTVYEAFTSDRCTYFFITPALGAMSKFMTLVVKLVCRSRNRPNIHLYVGDTLDCLSSAKSVEESVTANGIGQPLIFSAALTTLWRLYRSPPVQ